MLISFKLVFISPQIASETPLDVVSEMADLRVDLISDSHLGLSSKAPASHLCLCPAQLMETSGTEILNDSDVRAPISPLHLAVSGAVLHVPSPW